MEDAVNGSGGSGTRSAYIDDTKNGGGSSDGQMHRYTSPNSRTSNNLQRHSAQQIQILERFFNRGGTHHPDEEVRMQLSRELGMTPLQVKFWFQNRRTQFKAKQGKQEMVSLRVENETFRGEIDALKEALENVVCKSCGGPGQVDQDNNYIKQQKLREENARLKQEIQRLSREVEKYTWMPVSQLSRGNPGMQGSSGMPVSQLNPGKQGQRPSGEVEKYTGMPVSQLSRSNPGMKGNNPGMPVSQLNPGMQGYPGMPVSQLNQGNPGMPVSQPNQGNPLYFTNGPSHDLLLPGSSPTPTIQMLPLGVTIADLDKSIMVDIARSAMNELNTLLQSDATFWINSALDGRPVLNLEAHGRNFPRAINNSPNVWTESSKDSRIVSMNSLELVDLFMDANKWVEAFPTIVLNAGTIEVISAGLMGSQNVQLQLMYEEIHVLSPLTRTRKIYFIRFCQQIEQNLWAIVDVGYDILQEISDSKCQVHRFPSGCHIKDLFDGHSEITWMEHMQIEDMKALHNYYKEHLYSGLAFGASRWLDKLERTCERLTFQMNSSTFHNLGEVNPCRRNLMKLSQKMVKSFCASINPADGQQLMIYETKDFRVHTTVKNCTNPGHPNIRVLSASATIWFPFSPQKILDFLGNENTRLQWEVVSNHTAVQEVDRIACGSHPWNYISVLGASSTGQNNNNQLILQESCFESSTALLVYCNVNLHTMNTAINSEDPSLFSLFPSGFAISPGGNTSGEMSGGSLVTILLHAFETNATSDNISREESADKINNFVAMTIDNIKAALN